MIKKPLFKKIRKKLSMMNFHLKISSRFNIFSFLLALNFVFFSNFSYGNESSGCTEEMRKSVESEVKEIYGVEWIKKYKLEIFKDPEKERGKFYSLYEKAKTSCVEIICNQLYGKSNIVKTNCQSLPGTPDKLDVKEMGLEFNRDEIEKNMAAKLKCSEENKALEEIINYAKKRKNESQNEINRDSINEILKNNNVLGCEKNICELILTNKSVVDCPKAFINRAFLKQFGPENIKSELKNVTDTNDGINLTDCKWAEKLPRRVTTECSVCVGYVICDAKSNQANNKIQTMRLATCKSENCQENSAQNCVEDQGFKSSKPEGSGQDDFIQDQDLIKKANSSKQ